MNAHESEKKDKKEAGAEESCRRGYGCCYCAKLLLGALVLLLLGGVIGFLAGRCGGGRAYCDHKAMMGGCAMHGMSGMPGELPPGHPPIEKMKK